MDRARATMVQGLTGSGRLLLVGDVNQVPCHLSHASRFAVYGALTCPLLRATGPATCASARTEGGVVNVHSQALYGYTGAGADVLERLQREMGINTTFSLTCSWRLPIFHVKHAVDFMHKHGRVSFRLEHKQSGALPGLIAYNANFKRYQPSATEDHAVLCRTNKELIRLRMELAKNNIPCHMAGRKDLASGLLKLLQQLAPVSPGEAAAGSECSFNSSLCSLNRDWDIVKGNLKRVISGEGEDSGVESGEEAEDKEAGQARRCRIDYAEVMLGMMNKIEATASPNSRSLQLLRENIAKFRDGSDVPQQYGSENVDAPGARVVRLMTIHKAKGMEFHR